MALLDFLKRKKEIEKARPKGYPADKKPVKVSDVKKEEKTQEKTTEKPQAVAGNTKTKNVRFSYDAIKNPHISEKASYLAEKDQYTFNVSPSYNKNEIKNAVEGIYNVNVLSVNVIKIPSKRRRLGKTEGFRKGYKKAVVKIKEGQKIEIL